jgi:hypothetical protein
MKLINQGMSVSDPQLMPRPESDGPRPPDGRPTHDPWGVKKAERLLTSLSDVLSARVVANEQGEVTEVHVLVQAGIAPKQVVRNVESALLAQLGLKIDHRRISVAQTATVQPIDVLEQTAVHAEARKRGVLFKKVDIRPAERPHRLAIVVTLEMGGQEIIGEYETADSAKARVQGAARAAVMALDKVLPSGTLELEGAMLVDAFGIQFAFAGVQVVSGRGGTLLTGTAEVKQTTEAAAALAVLDATNRWLNTLR